MNPSVPAPEGMPEVGAVAPVRKTGRKKGKRLKKILIAAVVLAAAVVLVYLWRHRPVAESNTQYIDSTVTRGDISVSISGPGAIAPNNQYEVIALVQGEILESPFEEGQVVEKGDILYRIDPENAINNIDKAQTALERSELSYEQTLNGTKVDYPNITASIGGIITMLYVEDGDNIQTGGRVADIVDSDHLLLTLPFNEGDATALTVGAAARVYLEDSDIAIAGSVRRVYDAVSVSATGAPVRSVEILLDNPGAVGEGDRATALVGSIACNDAGIIGYLDTKTVTARSGGKIQGLTVRQGDRVSAGQRLAVVTFDAGSSTELQIRSASLGVKDAQLNLENAEAQLDDYVITAPISGTVLKKTSKAGDTLDTTNTRTVMAIIADMSQVTFDISVDELDISSVEVGQTVEVTADALPSSVFVGRVDSISMLGTTQNGVTTYPVKVVIEDHEGLLPGMNVNGAILFETAENVLRVPAAAVIRGNFVLLKLTEGQTEEAARQEHALSSAPAADGGRAPFGGGTGAADGDAPAGAPSGRGAYGGGADAADGGAPAGAPPGRGTYGGGADAADSNAPAGAPPDRGAYGGGADAADSDAPAGERPAANRAEAPAGYVYIQVRTGINDDTWIEITDGLREGDVVATQVNISSTSNGFLGMQSMGGGGMMSGGARPAMPAGGNATFSRGG
ncbi:MAG: efflux RND transporter periplasmic adaptor subunit [Oscillospiraceae bacterium]|nr:efflux RND transporter periplasmic adaptor subunit [Oscillospiraceae bacterium]